jgi:calnexin
MRFSATAAISAAALLAGTVSADAQSVISEASSSVSSAASDASSSVASSSTASLPELPTFTVSSPQTENDENPIAQVTG